MVSDDEWDDWYKKRLAYFDRFWKEIFKDIEEMDRALEGFSDLSPEEWGKLGRPQYYGFSINVGPDGKPTIREFGNVKRRGLMPNIRDEIEPLTDVVEKEKEVTVVAEVPGVDKGDISLTCDGRRLKIEARSSARKYLKELHLPAEVDPKSGKATYRNGILEVRLTKRTPSAPAGEEIKIE
jgi:HSP20 family protein